MKRKRPPVVGEQNITKFFKASFQERKPLVCVAIKEEIPLCKPEVNSETITVKSQNILSPRKPNKTSKYTPLKSENILTAFARINSGKTPTCRKSSDLASENSPGDDSDLEILAVSLPDKMDSRGQISFEEEMAKQAKINQLRYNRKVRRHSSTNQSKTAASKGRKSPSVSDNPAATTKETIKKSELSDGKRGACASESDRLSHPRHHLSGSSANSSTHDRHSGHHDSLKSKKHDLSSQNAKTPSSSSRSSHAEHKMRSHHSNESDHRERRRSLSGQRSNCSTPSSVKSSRSDEKAITLDPNVDAVPSENTLKNFHHERRHRHRSGRKSLSDRSPDKQTSASQSPMQSQHSSASQGKKHSHHSNSHKQHLGETSSGSFRQHSFEERVNSSKHIDVSRNLFESADYSSSQDKKSNMSDVEPQTSPNINHLKVKAGVSKLHKLFRKIPCGNASDSSGYDGDSVANNEHEVSSQTKSPRGDAHPSGGSRLGLALAESDSWRLNEDEQHIVAKSAENDADKVTACWTAAHSAASFTEYSGSGDVLADSDDDDDDSLAPSMLAAPHPQLQPRNPPSSPSSSHTFSPLVPCSPLTEAISAHHHVHAAAVKPPIKLSFSLDTLLSDKIQQDATDREISELDVQLKEGLEQGGITGVATALQHEEDMLPEHKQELVKLRIKDSVIRDVHPGKTTFHHDRHKQLFSEDIALSSFGFTPGNSSMDKQISVLPPAVVCELLTSNVLTMCVQTVACPHSILNWLFHLMSVHPSPRICQGAFKNLCRVLHCGTVADWAPSVTHFARVFVNLGAELDGLCEDGERMALGIDQLRLNSQPRVPNVHSVDIVHSLQQVIQTMCYALQQRSHCYTGDDIVAMTMMLCSVALDQELNDDVLRHDFVVCLSALFNAIPDDHWIAKAAELCERLPCLDCHHHNCVYLVSLMPPVPRGYYMQRHLALVMLQQLIQQSERRPDVREVTLEDLLDVVGELRITAETDYYYLSSLIQLIDLAVGNETLKSAEKVKLKTLIDKLRSMMGNVREHPSLLERTKVKDMMVRITAKWTFMAQSMPSKQKSIFAYTESHSPQILPIEKVECSQGDEDDDVENASQSGDVRDLEADQSESEVNDIDQSEDLHEQNSFPLSCDSTKAVMTMTLPEIE